MRRLNLLTLILKLALLLFSALASGQNEQRWLELGDPVGARVYTQWVLIEQSASSLTLSRDGRAIQSLKLEFAIDPVANGSGPERLEQGVRAYRQRFLTDYLHLMAAQSVEFGSWRGFYFDLAQSDDNGLRWRTRIYHLGQSNRQFSAVYRAPQLYFFGRDLKQVEAMIRSIE